MAPPPASRTLTQGPAGGAAASAAAGAWARWSSLPALWRAASLALFFAVWEIAARSGFSYALPSFTATAAAFWEMLADGSLGTAFAKTLYPLAIGLAFSLTVGIAGGVIMGLRRDVEFLSLPIFIVMQAAPMAALIPLVTFVYGIGLTAKVMAVVLLAMPVITINSYKAVRNVPPSLTAMARSFMGTRRQQITHVILPAASPMIFAGARLGVAEGFSGIVLAELLITPTGVGDLITFHRSVANFAHMYATIAAIVAFAVIAVSLLQRLETALFRPEKRSQR